MTITDNTPSEKRGVFRKSMLIVCGPSGVGKTTLIDGLLAARDNAGMAVSHTTRSPRGNEKDGVEYHFVDETVFSKMVQDGEFAEHAHVHGKLYGTSLAEIHAAWNKGKDVIFDIDYQGALQLKEHFPEAILVLIAPPSIEVLEERLTQRGTDSADAIKERLSVAMLELGQWPRFDYVIRNNDLEEATKQLIALYDAAALRVSLNEFWLKGAYPSTTSST